MFNKKYYPIILSVIFVFVVKFLLSYLPSFGFDMGSWLGWAGRLADGGFANFYSDTDWTQYTPGYLYYLWFIGKAGLINEFAIKIPVIVADILVGLIIWNLVRKTKKIGIHSENTAIFSFFFYALNPVILFDGSVWGQIDGLLTLFLFLSAYFLIESNKLYLSAFFWSLAFLIKPQSMAILPLLFASIFIKKIKIKDVLISGFVGLLTILTLSYPFFVSNPILGLPQWIIKMGSFYSYTSVFAFNIWSWHGFWRPDNIPFFGLNLSVWGVLFLVSGISFAIYSFRNKLTKKANYYLLFAVLSLCFFLFPTKVHERYLFPTFSFLLTAAYLNGSKKLLAVFFAMTIGSFLNLYYPYAYYYKNILFSQFLYDFSESSAKLIGLGFLLSYFVMIFWEKIPKIKLPKLNWNTASSSNDFNKNQMPQNHKKALLVAILAFAFISRVYNLGEPVVEYFDEVYHAFTAKVILHDDPKAWEWWNTPPEGFAYEWTHPPLAKLGMFLGMKVFGENSFGYRIPSALLGVGIVYLIYLLSKKLFNDETLALMAALVYSFDGLTLVMNRIGMNDSYLLFFSLLSVYAFLKNNDLLSSLAFGLAISSKWSALWVVPILALLWLRRKNKFNISIFSFFLLPPFVYMLSYAPMFLSGHDFAVWWEMQKQMWWYHTGLKATHPYSSAWWTWPFLIRPIYLYTSGEIGGLVSRIYAFGNPIVFWFGFASVFLSFVYAFFEKNKNLGFVIFSYLIFFVPWALSPRIMFLYHYLPSIPFLAISTAYVLRRNPSLIKIYFIAVFFIFIYFYPHWIGLKVPLWLDTSYYWVGSWR